MNNYVGLTKKVSFFPACGQTSMWGPIGRIEGMKYRIQLDCERASLIRKYGLSIPQDINDALTRKHLELKKRGE